MIGTLLVPPLLLHEFPINKVRKPIDKVIYLGKSIRLFRVAMDMRHNNNDVRCFNCVR